MTNFSLLEKQYLEKNDWRGYCEKCGIKVFEDDVVYFDGQFICVDCYSEIDNCDYCNEKVNEIDRVDTVEKTFCDDDCKSRYEEEK